MSQTDGESGVRPGQRDDCLVLGQPSLVQGEPFCLIQCGSPESGARGWGRTCTNTRTCSLSYSAGRLKQVETCRP